MKLNINKLAITGLLTFVAISGCEEKLEVLDGNSPTQESYFQTASELQNGVNAIYSSIRGGSMMAREWFFLHDMRGAETAPGGPQLEAPRAELLKEATAAPTNSVMSDVWRGSYQMINRANLAIEKGPGVTDNTALRDRLIGEAKFLRGWAYYELVSQWGEVPLYTEPVSSSTGFKGKSPIADIYAQIITDLTEAAAALPPSYNDAERGRVTKGAANAMLGRVNMQKGDYAAAKAALLQVVNSNLYSLVPNFLDNFNGDVKLNAGTQLTLGTEFNSESVFEVVFTDKGDYNFNWGYNGEGPTNPVSTMRPQEYGVVWGNVIPSDRILNEFEAGDPRFKMTFYEAGDIVLTKGGTEPGVVMTATNMNVAASNKNGDVKKRIYRKYSDLDWRVISGDLKSGGHNQRVIRYADVLLMLAECEAEGSTPAQAATYINMVRSRSSVNMPDVTTPNKDAALRAVMHERAVELAGEEINNIDLLRWRKKGYFPSIMADPRPGQAEFLPIPASEISTNPELQ